MPPFTLDNPPLKQDNGGMQQLIQTIPDPVVLINLPTEELAMRLLPLLAERERQNNNMIMGTSLCGEISNIVRSDRTYVDSGNYRIEHLPAVQEAFMEAWCWLEVQGLVVPPPDSNGSNGWRRLSRRARKLITEGNFKDFVAAKQLPKELLHPSIRETVWMAFIRGEYDNAVLQAMKQVEVAVRTACDYGAAVIGTTLMRKAFHSETGPLTDKAALSAEREARQHLFAGAIGSYKNPQSHRHVNLDDPHEAVEQVMLASHLLRIIDSRAEANQTQPK